MKIAFFDITPFEREYFDKKLGDFEKHYFSTALNCNTIVDACIKDVEILCVFVNSTLDKKVLEQFPNLKVIVLRSVGFSHVDLCYTKENDIKIYTSPHYGDYSIAEFTFGLLLNIVRKITKASNDVKNQHIQTYEGVELFNKTIGIIGLGATGEQVAQIAKGFKMNVVYYDIKRNSDYKYLPLDELCSVSDIISINCPLNQKTIYMFDTNRFEKVKHGAILINTARGKIVNTCALYNALISGKISYAALDVVECEDILYQKEADKININSIKETDLKNYFIIRKLLSMDNVIITPHIAYNTEETKKRILEITVNNILSSIKFTK